MRAESVKVSEIHPAPDNLRHRLGRLKELEASIEAVGILQPIVVRPDTDGYEIVAGHRRFQAALNVGLSEVPTVIRDDLVDAARIEAMIVENFHREDLTPIEQAEGLFALSELGLDRDTIAEKTGLSKRLVGERIRLLDLTPKARTMIQQGQLSIEAGLDLAKAGTDPKILDEALEELREGRARSADEAVKRARQRADNVATYLALTEKAERLKGLGVEVVEFDPAESTSYYRGFESPRSWRILTDRYDGLQVDAKAHAKEPCAVFVLTKPHADGFRMDGPRLDQFCSKPKRHTFTGDSELKVARAEETAQGEQAERARRKKEREAAAAKQARYAAAVEKKPARKLVADIAMRGFISKIWSDHVKGACQLLGIEAEKRNDYKDWATPFQKFAEGNLERAILALVLVDTDPLGRSSYGSYLTDEQKTDLLALIPEEKE